MLATLTRRLADAAQDVVINENGTLETMVTVLSDKCGISQQKEYCDVSSAHDVFHPLTNEMNMSQEPRLLEELLQPMLLIEAVEIRSVLTVRLKEEFES